MPKVVQNPKRVQAVFSGNMEKMLRVFEQVEGRERSEILRDAFMLYASNNSEHLDYFVGKL